MSVEITVQLYPAPGGGVQAVQGPRGEILHVPIPFLNYERVQRILCQNKDYIHFIAKDGSEIESNMPWLIRKVNVAEGNA